MRVEYINPFVESANNVLAEVLQCEVTRGELYLKSNAAPVLGVAAIIGLAGDVEGRVLLDMSRSTAIDIANAMLKSMDMDPIDDLNDMGRATITELANMVTGQAVTKLENLGFKFDLTPPALVTGDNMEISNQNVEALIVPIEVTQGKIEINVAIRERG
jgi:chemotaxis protein CheX